MRARENQCYFRTEKRCSLGLLNSAENGLRDSTNVTRDIFSEFFALTCVQVSYLIVVEVLLGFKGLY